MLLPVCGAVLSRVVISDKLGAVASMYDFTAAAVTQHAQVLSVLAAAMLACSGVREPASSTTTAEATWTFESAVWDAAAAMLVSDVFRRVLASVRVALFEVPGGKRAAAPDGAAAQAAGVTAAKRELLVFTAAVREAFGLHALAAPVRAGATPEVAERPSRSAQAAGSARAEVGARQSLLADAFAGAAAPQSGSVSYTNNRWLPLTATPLEPKNGSITAVLQLDCLTPGRARQCAARVVSRMNAAPYRESA